MTAGVIAPGDSSKAPAWSWDRRRGGRSAEEHLVAALRCLYRHAEDDGLITEAGNPARKVAKPRRLPSVPQGRPERPAR